MVISMLKIRRPLGRLIFNMGIAIPGKTVFLIETAPWCPVEPIMQIVGIFFVVILTKLLNKLDCGRFEAPRRSCNVFVITFI